jgi:hypothetical protein
MFHFRPLKTLALPLVSDAQKGKFLAADGRLIETDRPYYS